LAHKHPNSYLWGNTMKRKLFLKGLFISPFVLKKEWLKSDSVPKPRKGKTLSNQIYFNWGTMGLMPKRVINAIKEELDFIEDTKAYGHTKEKVEVQLAKLVNADLKQVVMLKNATEGACIASSIIPLDKGDEVLISTHEHVGGCANWINMVEQSGAKLKTFELAKTQVETLDNYKKSITAKTKVVAFPHIPCTTGLVLPIEAMASFAKSKGIAVCIDGAHTLGMIKVDMKSIDCDFYYGCLHKWMRAPLGTGWMYCSTEALAKYKSNMVGAYGIDTYDLKGNPSIKIDELDARKFAYGTYSTALRVGVLAAFEEYEKHGAEWIENRVVGLSQYFHQELNNLKYPINLLIDPSNTKISGITGFVLMKDGENSSQDFIKANNSSFRLRFLSEAGLDAIRVSLHYTNTKEEIDLLIKAIDDYYKS